MPFWILIALISRLKSTQPCSLHCCNFLCAWIIQYCSLSALVVYCMVKNQWRERLNAWGQALFSTPAAKRVSYVRGWGVRVGGYRVQHPLHDNSCRFIICLPHPYSHFLRVMTSLTPTFFNKNKNYRREQFSVVIFHFLSFCCHSQAFFELLCVSISAFNSLSVFRPHTLLVLLLTDIWTGQSWLPFSFLKEHFIFGMFPSFEQVKILHEILHNIHTKSEDWLKCSCCPLHLSQVSLK